jgi:hypothetical protein
MQIVDLSSMLVTATANQADAAHFQIGQPARVRFDAYPDLELPARVFAVGTYAKASGFRSGFIRELPIQLKLERTDARVIPNLTASADIVLESISDASIIPREAVFGAESRQKPFALVRGQTGWRKREVELGMANHIAVAVASGIQPGEVVALERPAGF